MAKKAAPQRRLKKTHTPDSDTKSVSVAPIKVPIESAQIGDIVDVERFGDGTSRSVVAVDFHQLEKGAIYMSRGHNSTWMMATKPGGPTDDPEPHIVFDYDGPFR